LFGRLKYTLFSNVAVKSTSKDCLARTPRSQDKISE
jgi:hypothetical protein